ncbi:4-hydroxy-tetrahydrodipicolinate synthase [Nesterenkonia sp. DZ6]|uniref:4-hydroxy-tetrahydrodipicolinate synthase n=1 Tax=Nesterenkonia sp. DZ6 TaxID=2901229 RepID=UPI001F4CD7C0|nr:4-hydroxy-tetrahydrodipicolinate synthase [Nesterenkonia sp. DZ6]MCH8560151.1 4-hydroxy-tetrahydrodipicolinate synthase [Nesterenkonia sp. DZ6]
MDSAQDFRFRITPQFGTVMTAMVTPFDKSGQLDFEGVRDLARWLTRDGWNDGLVVNGTTGESITTTDAEKTAIIRTVSAAVGGTATVIAGVGVADTQHSIELAQAAAAAGADGLMVVAPYYCRPDQAGLLRHFTAIADSTSLPVMLYDIPKRTGVEIRRETLVAAAEHPQIVAVKDAKGDLASSSWVMRHTDLAYYSGDDVLNLPLLSIGATGFVSVVGHVAADLLRHLHRCHQQGRTAQAAGIHRQLLAIYEGMFRSPAAASVKAALAMRGLPAGPVRMPLVELDEAQREQLSQDLTASGIPDRSMPSRRLVSAEATVSQSGQSRPVLSLRLP